MILDDIVAYKRRYVESCKALTPPREMVRRAEAAPPARDFAAALRRPDRMALIAEVKKASPSKGVIRPDFDPAAIARAYAGHGADALSCLTDEKFFQGSLEIFRTVRATVGLPMLRKEFIIDEYQIHEARSAGADAVLLICAILTDSELAAFQRVAAKCGMAALIEVHAIDEAKRAAQSGARIVGVNNRNLASPDLRTDIRHSDAILPHLPPQAVKVSESGIYSADHVRHLRDAGFDAILVGEHFMRQADPGAAIDKLLET